MGSRRVGVGKPMAAASLTDWHYAIAGLVCSLVGLKLQISKFNNSFGRA
ncbi:MAG: hypothetical protein ACI832_002998 [Rheinheimera aquimaris]|jgi:hypothetical protein